MRPSCFERPGSTWTDDDRWAAKVYLFGLGEHRNDLRRIAAVEFSKWRDSRDRPLFEDKDVEDSIDEYAFGRLKTKRGKRRNGGAQASAETGTTEIGEVCLQEGRFDKRTVPDFDPAEGVFEKWNKSSFRIFVHNWARREAFLRNKAIRIDEPLASDSAATLADLLEDEDTTHPGLVIEKRQAIEMLTKALERIEAEDRQILVFHYADGLPGKGIARRLGLSEEAVRTRLKRARWKLLEMTITIVSQACVRLLAERQQSLLRFRYLEGNSSQRIAERLGISVDQAEQELHLARTALYSKLGEEFGDRFRDAWSMFTLYAKIDWNIVFEDSGGENP